MKKILKKLLVLTTIVSTISGFGLTASASDSYVVDKGWNQNTLNFYIDDSTGDPQIPSINYLYWGMAIENGIATWNTALEDNNIDLEIHAVTNRQDADIIFEYGVSSSFANTVLSYNADGSIKKATVIMDDMDFYIFGFNTTLVRNIAAHETGHTIGLKDIDYVFAEQEGIYSIMINKIVVPSPNFSIVPTAFDINNIEKLY